MLREPGKAIAIEFCHVASQPMQTLTGANYRSESEIVSDE